jgi:hypothetical protein
MGKKGAGAGLLAGAAARKEKIFSGGFIGPAFYRNCIIFSGNTEL